LGQTTGLPSIHAIRKYYGPVASAVVGKAVFVACLFFTMGNISGTGAGMNLIFGIDWKIGSVIMGLALLGAGFSSLLANTQRGMVLLGAGFNKDVGLETKFIRYGCLVCLIFAMIICYSYGGSPTQLILLANIGTSIATPVGGLFILLLLWRSDVNEGYKKPTALRICMTISYLFALIMTISALSTQIPKLLAIFGIS
jgi:Mn2+/Fe2+ NRAMP family transporter